MLPLSIIIVNWNTRDLLGQCLDSIFQTINADLCEVIVVDNASTDTSTEMVQKRFPQVQLIQNSWNVGFARANNQGIRQSIGRYVLLLNSDTIVMPGALQALLAFMDTHPEAGCAGARLLNPDTSLQYSCSSAPTISSEFRRMLHLPGVRSDGYYPMDRWDLSQPHQVDVILGACMLLRRETLDQVGLMDESFFMYSEEVDLCYRIHRAGWQIYWIPQAQVVHIGGQSSRQASAEMFLRLYESKLIYFRKNHGRIRAGIYKLLLAISSLIRLSLVPLVCFESTERRQAHLAQAGNYERLLVNLLTM
jgi:N-acetylglucosaminyl-diphospho-decaprenol L-rhamnosyltransferase